MAATSFDLAKVFTAESTIRAAVAQGDIEEAARLTRTLYGEAVARYCLAVLADSKLAELASGDIWERTRSELPRADLAATIRSVVLGLARRRCAHLSETAMPKLDPTSGDGCLVTGTGAAKPSTPDMTRRLLQRLRPSDRELLVLRYVNQLSYAEMSAMAGRAEVETRKKLSEALVRAVAADANDETASVGSPREQLAQFEAQLADIVDRTAPPELLSTIAESEELRDRRHAAERLVLRIAQAANVHVEDDASTLAPHTNIANAPGANAMCEADRVNAPVASETSEVDRVNAPTTAASVDGSSTDAGATKAASDVTPPEVATPCAPPPFEPPPEGAAPGAGAPKASAASHRSLLAFWIALSVAGALGVLVLLFSRTSANSSDRIDGASRMRGTISALDGPEKTSLVELCSGTKGPCDAAKVGARVEPGTIVRTNARARATVELDTGETVSLDRATTVAISEGSSPELRLRVGTATIDGERARAASLTVAFALGRVESSKATYTIVADSSQALVQVRRGRVKIFDSQGHEEVVAVGEAARIRAGRGITVDYSRNIHGSILGPDAVDGQEYTDGMQRGIGELRAKKPGEDKERADAVRLKRHHVKIRVVGPIARTEIDETFANESNEVLEGIYRFPLPADAQIERLALEVDGKLIEGAFVERDRAGAIWRGSIVQAAPQLRAQMKDEIIWVPGPWRDPALLEWQRGNRFELRIFPIPKKGSRRIVLSYTQVVPVLAGLRHYNYPLQRPTGQKRGVEEFALDVSLRGYDPSLPPVITGYEGQTSSNERESTEFSFSEREFSPRGDLSIEYEVPEDRKNLLAWAYQAPTPAERPFVAMLLRPRLPIASELKPRTYVFVVDSSRSMVGESLRRANAVTVSMIRDLSDDSTVTLMTCDSECRRWSEGFQPGGASAAHLARNWLQSQTAEGASDLAGSIEAALDAAQSAPNEQRHIVYVGDGTPTAGPTRPATLELEVRRRIAPTTVDVTAVAVGVDSDLDSLRALARGGRGVVVPYTPGVDPSRVSQSALAATLGNRLVDPRVELPPGVVAIAPERLDTIAEGDETLIVGRIDGKDVRGEVVLRGRVGGADFEQRYAIELQPTAGERNAFVPRLYAARRMADLERLGSYSAKSEAIELSRRFGVASRYTSLLVLESAAMFDAFGLDNVRKGEIWTGDLEAEATASAAEGGEEHASADFGSASPSGGAAGPSMKRAAAPSPAASPAPMKAKSAPSFEASGDFSARGRALASDSIDEPRERPAVSPRQRMVPMRRIWERKGEIIPGKAAPSASTRDKTVAIEQELDRNPDRRALVKQLLDAYQKGSDVTKASELAARWSERDPLDVEALVARADVAARRGERALAIRILGSVIDVRPSDVGAQQRLSRLHRWQGRGDRACRFSIALAEFRPKDEQALAEALRCLGEQGREELAGVLRSTAADTVLRAAERLLEKNRAAERLTGDLRVTARWHATSPVDVDLALIDPDAHRVSWLGAPTRAVISATSVTSHAEEGLGLRGGKPGEYLLEVVRGSGSGIASGTIVVAAAGARREIPFTLDAERAGIGVVKITMMSRLVPLEASTAFRWNP